MIFNLPYSWLKEYIKVPEANKLAGLLSTHGATVERLHHVAYDFSGVVVGQVLKLEKHPNADKLQIAEVSTGKNETRTIVCGAPNIRVGAKVPVALPGAILPGDFRIMKREVRGVVSDGMICSGKELGVSDDHVGIMIMDSQTKVGAQFSKLGEEKDYVLEIEPTTNRPDLCSVIGVAREVSAITREKINSFAAVKNADSKKTSFKLAINDSRCLRFMATKVTNVTVEASPWWLQERLMRAGIRPINNMVDITNYVMLEVGHPMHVFDADKLGNKIGVRVAKSTDKIVALDGKSYAFSKGDIVIVNENNEPVSIPGLMGGEDTGVTFETTNVVFEAASWDKQIVRQMERTMLIFSDAAKLFEKGLSPELTSVAMNRALQLLSEHQDITIEKTLDVYPKKVKPVIIEFKLTDIKRLLGIEIANSVVRGLLQRLGFDVKSGKTKDSLLVVVPAWRAFDVSSSVDLVEEVARLYGYDKFEPVMPKPNTERSDRSFDTEKYIRRLLQNIGFTETFSNSLIPQSWIIREHISVASAIKVLNPLSVEMEYMRPSLVSSLLKVIEANQGRYDEMKIYEMSKVYERIGDGKTIDTFRKESMRLCGAIVMPSTNHEQLFRVGKGVLSELGIAEFVSFGRDAEHRVFDEGMSVRVRLHGEDIGCLGFLKKNLLKEFGVSNDVLLFDLFVEPILHNNFQSRYSEIPRYPVAKRDISLVLDEHVRYTDIADTIYRSSNLIVDLELFDIYQDENLGDGRKSYAIHVTLSHSERTLEARDIDEAMQRVAANLKSTLNVDMR